MATYPIDLQLARWLAAHGPMASVPRGAWSSPWLTEYVSRRYATAATCSPPRAASDRRDYAGEAAASSSQIPTMPDWWGDVLPPLKAAYWHIRLLGADPIVLVAMAQELATRPAANAVVDECAAQATTVASSIALPELVPAVAQRRQRRLTTEHRSAGNSERAARRGRTRGPAWEIEQQLVDDLVAGIVDIRARRTVIAAHARVLLTARGFSFQVDYSRPALDCVVQAALATAMAVVRTRA